MGLPFADTQCGFKAFTRAAAQTVFQLQTIERWGFDPEILFIALKRGFWIIEVPVSWAHDERTRMSYLKDGMRMLQDLAHRALECADGPLQPANRSDSPGKIKVAAGRLCRSCSSPRPAARGPQFRIRASCTSESCRDSVAGNSSRIECAREFCSRRSGPGRILESLLRWLRFRAASRTHATTISPSRALGIPNTCTSPTLGWV